MTDILPPATVRNLNACHAMMPSHIELAYPNEPQAQLAAEVRYWEQVQRIGEAIDGLMAIMEKTNILATGNLPCPALDELKNTLNL